VYGDIDDVVYGNGETLFGILGGGMHLTIEIANRLFVMQCLLLYL
jgi:hypothetical protein